MKIGESTVKRHVEYDCHDASTWRGTNFLNTASDSVCGQRLTQFQSQRKKAFDDYHTAAGVE